jgi:hypothetical protein
VPVAPDAFPSEADRGVVQKVDSARQPDLRSAAEMFCRSSAAAGASAGQGEVHLQDVDRLGQVALTPHALYWVTDHDCLWATADVADRLGVPAACRSALVRLAKPPRDE